MLETNGEALQLSLIIKSGRRPMKESALIAFLTFYVLRGGTRSLSLFLFAVVKSDECCRLVFARTHCCSGFSIVDSRVTYCELLSVA